MRARCGCKCEAKIVKDAISVVLSIANAHSKEYHEQEQGIKYLSHKQKCLVAESVKIAPMYPAETESEATYTAAYRASKKATRKLMRMRLCDKEECFTCRSIEQLKSHPSVAACLNGAPYKGPEKELPISACLGDNTFSVQNFSSNTLGLDANLCQTHTTAIPANKTT